MAVSKAQQRAVTKYDAKAYDKTLLRLPKGRLDIVKAHATAHGESVNGFIGRAILEAMERDGGGTALETAGKPPESTQGGEAVFLPAETLKAAQEAAEAAGETVSAFVSRAVNSFIPRKIKVVIATDTAETSTPKFAKVTFESGCKNQE